MDRKSKDIRTVILITAGILIVAITMIYFLLPAQTITKQMDVKVQHPLKIGFNIDTDALHFGIVPAGSFAERKVVIENDMGRRLVRITSTGEMASWIKLSENNFILEPNSNKTLELTVNIPQGTEQGNYTGTAIIRFYRR